MKRCRPALVVLNVVLFLMTFSVLLVLLFKWAPVRVTPLMIRRSVAGISDDSFKTREKWVSIDDISPEMVLAVIAGEDNRFVEHNGFDFEEMKKMRDSHREKGTKIRGCSTISQQTAKNCFTWCSSTWARKAVEAWWTVLVEKIWGKRRIMEVYLNVVELGSGIYGVQAASLQYFGVPASELTAVQAASLAYCLPSPLKRSPVRKTSYMLKRRSEILALMRKVPKPSWLSD